MRLIDADELLSVVRHMTVVDKSVMHRILIQMQTVDAVEVVRCRECRWWHDWNGECYAKEAQGFGHLWEADDYCSFGERKDGDHETD